MNSKSYLFMCLLILCGCTAAGEKNSPALEQTATRLHPATPILATPTQLPTRATNPSEMIMGSETRCLEKQNEQDFTKFAHTQLITSTELGISEYKLLDFQNPNADLDTDLDFSNMSFLNISPNKKHLFYRDAPSGYSENWSYVLSDAQQIIKRYPMDSQKEKWQSTFWLDSEHILIWQSAPNPTFVLFNPFTGEEKSVSPDLPGVFRYPIQTAAAYLASDLKKSVYFSKVGQDQVIVWDIEAQEKLVQILIPEKAQPWMPWTGWSFDRTKLAISGYAQPSRDNLEDIFILDMSGAVQQLTRFSEFYQMVIISGLSWSPDGRFISFRLKISENAENSVMNLPDHLMLADLQTEKVFNLCLKPAAPRMDWNPDASSYGGVVWSPDSRYMAVAYPLSQVVVDVFLSTYQVIPGRQSESSKTEFPVAWIFSETNP